MVKLLLIILIVLIAFWMGRQSAAAAGRKEVQKRDTDDKITVIDIETED